MADEKPRIDKVTAEYFRKGKCAHCNKAVERIKSFTGTSLGECDAQARIWEKAPLAHKKCEAFV